ncbi:MAG: hypothetical protein ABIL21_05085 [candidate division WOR-3 bacterium]
MVKKFLLRGPNGDFYEFFGGKGKIWWIEGMQGAGKKNLLEIAKWPYAYIKELSVSDEDLRYPIIGIDQKEVEEMIENIRKNLPKDEKGLMDLLPGGFREIFERVLTKGYEVFSGEGKVEVILNLLETGLLDKGLKVATVFLPLNSAVFFSENGEIFGISFPGEFRLGKGFFEGDGESIIKCKVFSLPSL